MTFEKFAGILGVPEGPHPFLPNFILVIFQNSVARSS